jgi:hypothetical protein
MILETMGSYLIGRCLIRTPEAFFYTIKLLFILTIIFFPFAMFETVTSRNLTLELFGKIGTTYVDVFKDPRWGLDRVQGPFEHPILFGVFFGSIVGPVFYVLGYKRSVLGRVFRTALTVITGAAALSSGPLTALVGQVFIITWDVIFRTVKIRWYILSGLMILQYIIIDTLSNRNPFEVFVSYLAFSSETAYGRLIIWEFGTQSILSNPIFGIGLSDNWVRPYWLAESVDMFWILPAMRHGIPVWILYFTLFFWPFISIIRLKGLGEKMNAFRMGYLSSMIGLFLAGWTVHFWNATFALFMFLLASGVWMLDYIQESVPNKNLDEKPSVKIKWARKFER